MPYRHLLLIMTMLFCVACSEKKEPSTDTDQGMYPDEDTAVADDPVTEDDPLPDQAPDEEQDTLIPDQDGLMSSVAITPGDGIGAVKVGMTYAEVKQAVGTTEDVMIYNRLAIVTYADLALEMLFTSPEDFSLTDTGRLIAVGAKTGGQFDFTVTHGMAKEEAVAAIEESGEDVGKRIYYPSGFSLEFDDAGLIALIGVFKAYVPRPEPPEMEPCATDAPNAR